MEAIGKQIPNNKTTAMSKRRKQAKRPSIRDAARSFIEAIIAERKAFESLSKVFERSIVNKNR